MGNDVKRTVLVVDDEEPIRQLVTTVLRYEGFDVLEAATGAAALALLDRTAVDLVVLDVMMPDVDGFEVQRLARQRGVDAAVLFLTARDGVEDRVRGLTAGADDFMVKPFSLDELVARVSAVLRRTRGGVEQSVVLRFEDLVMDESAHVVTRCGEEVELTPTEYKLLRFMLRNPRRVLTRAQILDHVWEYDFGGEGNVVETYVSYLRRKVDRNRPPLIHTVRGVGYCLRGGV